MTLVLRFGLLLYYRWTDGNHSVKNVPDQGDPGLDFSVFGISTEIVNLAVFNPNILKQGRKKHSEYGYFTSSIYVCDRTFSTNQWYTKYLIGII